MRTKFLATLLILLLAAGSAGAQAGAKVVKLTVTPAAAPTPALKYHLLPWATEQRPGNAAVFYERAVTWEWGSIRRTPGYDQLHEWLDQPMTEELATKLKPFADSHAVREFDVAARCEYVDWQLAPRVREEGFSLLIPDIQAFRTVVQLLAARARLEMHRGQTDKAIQSVQTGLALARHLSEEPTLIAGLVGIASGMMMLNRVEELIQQPQTPSLYWAFTELPTPLVDLRRGLQGERLSIDGLFPELRQALNDPHLPAVTPESIRQRLDRLSGILGDRIPGAGYAGLFALLYPRARAHFLEQGYRAEQIDALPVSQVVLMYELRLYDRWMDDYCKLYNLPYWQARPRLARVDQEMREAKQQRFEGVLAHQVVPALQRVLQSQARLDRRIALLRTIEALRLHAAAHGGKLPDSLDDLRDVPLPADPFTGKAFFYTRRPNGQGILEGPPPPGEEANEGNAIRYEITLAPRQE